MGLVEDKCRNVKELGTLQITFTIYGFYTVNEALEELWIRT